MQGYSLSRIYISCKEKASEFDETNSSEHTLFTFEKECARAFKLRKAQTRPRFLTVSAMRFFTVA